MNGTSPAVRPIKRLLVVNRGEIAVRILQAARELPFPVETIALYTSDDRTHCELSHPDQEILIPSLTAYMDISYLIRLTLDHNVDTIHPGYGFLSENADFARRMWDEARVTVIGPGWEVLMKTGDKLQAKTLAEECGVPVLRATNKPTSNLAEIEAFVSEVGLPVMVKAVDGGGGLGIRLVLAAEDLSEAVDRAIRESPSHSVFVEKAAVAGFHHIEVQIVGDSSGHVCHLWERDCSIQRRFQKVVECAPSISVSRELIGKVINAALAMAKQIGYRSLGTFEFLVNELKSEFYFLEINPRLQVEHTITENIAGVDLVRAQLLLGQGFSFTEAGLDASVLAARAPSQFSIQFRLCAENPKANFALSIGKITEFTFPGGNGLRVDSNLCPSTSVGTDFDNLLAKITVTASTWEATVRKAQRALADIRIVGVKTNLDLLRGIATEKTFLTGDTDTQWLQAHLQQIIQRGEDLSPTLVTQHQTFTQSSTFASSASAFSGRSIQNGDGWSITLEPAKNNMNDDVPHQSATHYIRFSRVLHNELPSALIAEVEYAGPSFSSPLSCQLHLAATDLLSNDATTSKRRQGDLSNPYHVVLQIPGKLMEMVVDDGDEIEENQVIAFVKQMKMEVEVRSPRAGKVKWAYEIDEEKGEEGEDVGEGTLLVEFENDSQVLQRQKPVSQKGKL